MQLQAKNLQNNRKRIFEQIENNSFVVVHSGASTFKSADASYNFFVNRKVVFKSSASVGKTMLKYYILCVCQLGVGMGIVYLLSEKLGTSGWLTTLLKIGVEACLFILSFQIQKRWVFASDKREE